MSPLSGKTESESHGDTLVEPAPAWVTIVWNDPVNLMNYVAYVFESYFGYSPERAHLLMMQVHEQGRAALSRGPREKIERDVLAMHEFGLGATMEKDGA